MQTTSPPISSDMPGMKHDTRAKDHYDQQMKLYTLCGCGSGKKFKFCCKNKARVVIETPSMTFIKAPEPTIEEVHVYKSNDIPMFEIQNPKGINNDSQSS